MIQQQGSSASGVGGTQGCITSDSIEIDVSSGETVYFVLPPNALNIKKYHDTSNGEIRVDIAYSYEYYPNTLIASSRGILVSSGNSYVEADDNAININALKGSFSGLRPSVKRLTSDYTLTSSDYFIVVDADTGTVNLTLPENPELGQRFEIRKAYSTKCVIKTQGNISFWSPAANVLNTDDFILGTKTKFFLILVYDGQY
jgi:hypothetical protein